MNIDWKIFAVVVLVNSAFILLVFLTQSIDESLPERGSLIPGTKQKFLYMQDFYTMTWGDLIGLALIFNAFAHLVVAGRVNLWVAAAIAVAGGLLFMAMCLSGSHKPDYGYPAVGAISLAGYLHLVYFGVGLSAGLMCAWAIVTGDLRGPVMWVAIAGGALYLGTFVLDITSGNFEPLKREANLSQFSS